MKKILIIGSNSFSGSNFVNNQLNEDYEVFATSRSVELNNVFLPYKKNSRLNNLHFSQLDLNKNLDELINLIKKEKISQIVNFAAQSMVGQSWDTPEHWYMTNTVSTIKFHNQLKNLDFLDKYVHISTPEVYGSCEGLIKEHRNYNPSTPYATSRAATDMSLKNFYDTYNFPVVFTRAANVFGEHQQLYRIVPKAIISFLIKEKVPLHGGGKSIRSFIHMDDVSKATNLILNYGNIGEIYHISTKQNISIKSLVEMIAKQLNIPFEENVEITEDRKGKDSAYLLDNSKLRESLNWQDTISLEEGIEKTISWVKDNLEELLKQPMNYIHKQ